METLANLPRASRKRGEGPTIQIIAMLTMLIDHVGIVFFPESIAWRIIGRIALPLYAYSIVLGYSRTRNRNEYLKRLLMLAILSQVPYMFSLNMTGINVVATFVVSLLALMVLDLEAIRNRKWAALAVVAAAAVFLQALPFSYGAYALLLILMYRYLPPKYWIAVHAALTIAFYYPDVWALQLFSIVPTAVLLFRKRIAEFEGKASVPRWLWRSFYPAHLLILAIAGIPILY